MSQPATVTQPPAAPNPVVDYFRLTRGAWYGYVFALPILAAYEALEFVFRFPVINGADRLIQILLSPLGEHRSTAFLVLLAVSGLLCWRYDAARRAGGPALRGPYLLGMFAESCVYALFLGEVVVRLMALLTGDALLQIGGEPGGFALNFAMALGAGIYEELVFRVLLMGGLILLFRRGFQMEAPLAWVLAVLASSIIFSAFHYLPPLGDPFRLDSFFFRFLAGAVLATLYAARGFGIAVWTHALYDLLVLLQGG